MTMGHLATLGDTDWAGLGALDIDEWLWLDTTAPGLHITNHLPHRPADITHLWGWASERWLRARIDHDLPGSGLVGAVLSVGSALGSVPTEYTQTQAPLWGISDGRVGRARQDDILDRPGANDPLRTATIRTAFLVKTGTDGTLTRVPLAFVALGP